MPKKLKLEGERFGRLIVVARNGKDKRGSFIWQCQCDCGASVIATGSNLVSGNTTSCGCYHRERQKEAPRKHGKTHSRVYTIWINMRQRCSNPNVPCWKNYGGRGISVCDRWQDFGAFYRDMGNPPDGHTLERIDVNGDYCPENCKWIPRPQQARNTRNNRQIKYRKEVRSLIEWAEVLGIDYYTLHSRLKRGWGIDRAFSTPVEKSL